MDLKMFKSFKSTYPFGAVLENVVAYHCTGLLGFFLLFTLAFVGAWTYIGTLEIQDDSKSQSTYSTHLFLTDNEDMTKNLRYYGNSCIAIIVHYCLSTHIFAHLWDSPRVAELCSTNS